MKESSIKVGMIAELTGALSFMGRANANVAKMVVGDINANGGLLGRQIDLRLEDGATTDSVAAAKATKLVQQDNVDVIFGGIFSSTRQAIKDPAVVKGKTLYIYPEQYEGQECDPLIFCTGGLRLWEAAVKEAGSLRQEDVIAALDHAKIAEGPGGPAAMAPGQRHVSMNMFIAQARNGQFEIVESLGAIEPNEASVPKNAEFRRAAAG